MTLNRENVLERSDVPIALAQFIDCLCRSGLMTAPDLAAFQDRLPAEQRANDAPALATQLVQAHRLTAYQAGVLSQGRSAGLVLGEYIVLDKLGEGGMGIVTRAQHRHTQRVVALKVLHPSVTQSADIVKRFRRELDAMSRLDHPNIVAAHEASERDGTHYFVMDFVEGKDLSCLVKENGALPVGKAVDCTIQAARGLAHAHEKGVVHRDIKPSNLLLDKQGTIKILDMGLVRFIDPDCPEGSALGKGGLTQTGDIMGSFDYIAPEQALDAKRADCRADIYSLGCTLFYLLAGRPLYGGDTSMQKLLAHRENPIPSLRKLRPEVPLDLEAVFQRMVAKKPDDRYPAIAEVLADLEACRQPRAPIGMGPPPALPTSPGRLPILCGTACVLGSLGYHAFLAQQAAVHQWTVPAHLQLVQWLVLGTGIGMILLGMLNSLAFTLLGRRPRPSVVRRPSPRMRRWTRFLVRGLIGVGAGGLAGAAAGGALAIYPSDKVHVLGSIAGGALLGGALGGRKRWYLMLAGALAGYLASGAIGKHGVTVDYRGLVLQLDGMEVTMLACGVLGAVAGAALGARLAARRGARSLAKRPGAELWSTRSAEREPTSASSRRPM